MFGKVGLFGGLFIDLRFLSNADGRRLSWFRLLKIFGRFSGLAYDCRLWTSLDSPSKN
jgi:hypothetical protein